MHVYYIARPKYATYVHGDPLPYALQLSGKHFILFEDTSYYMILKN